MGTFSEWNDDVRFVLMVIDVCSKYEWIRILKDKRGVSFEKAF